MILPFSYMTFVIKDAIEHKDPLQEGNIFDPEPFNYIFNRSSSFIHSPEIINNPNMLSYILENFEKTDPKILELLLYTQILFKENEMKSLVLLPGLADRVSPAQENTALHIAYDLKNSRSVDILLRYMSKTQSDSSKNFRKLFPLLVERGAFQYYIDCLTFQTINMKQKQILKIDQPLNNTVVKLGHSMSKYVDSNMFKKCMDEDKANKDYQSYPVEVIGIRI